MPILIHYQWAPTQFVGRGKRGTEVYFGSSVESIPGRRVRGTVVVGAGGYSDSGVHVLLEPPSVLPMAYTTEWRKRARRVYSFSGPFLENVELMRCPWPFGWPELPDEPDRTPWEERIDGVVCVAGAKGPAFPVDDGELYTRRFRVMKEINNAGIRMDWYGRPGPHGNTTPESVWPFYRGECPGDAHEKRRLMSGYRFALCWENWAGPGYVTEKLPDALAAGCIPLYRTEDVWVKKHLYHTLLSCGPASMVGTEDSKKSPASRNYHFLCDNWEFAEEFPIIQRFPRQCRSYIDAKDIISSVTAEDHSRFLNEIDLPKIRQELSPQPLFDSLEELICRS